MDSIQMESASLQARIDLSSKGSTTNDNVTDNVPEFAPSLAEADAILAQFGFSEVRSLAVA